jgi:VanZ family protein
MRKFAYFLPASIYYLAIFFVSSKDYDLPIDIRLFDKSAHFVEFAVLGFLLALGFFNAVAAPVKTKLLLSFFASVSLAGLDEFHQFFVPGRAVEIFDLLADALGAAGGILVYLHFCRRKKRLKSGSPTGLS